jgi:hypothetical protein
MEWTELAHYSVKLCMILSFLVTGIKCLKAQRLVEYHLFDA